jgi:thiamine biosynthesis lipoprotein ApbE
MGCDVVVGGAAPAEARGIERLFAERDRTFSRFRAGSELSRVNRSSSAVVSVSAAFVEMVGIALRAAARTRRSRRARPLQAGGARCAHRNAP